MLTATSSPPFAAQVTINEALAGYFQVGVQFRKTCSHCLSYEDSPPETFTSLPLSVKKGTTQIESSIETFLKEKKISIFCPTCQVAKPHTRDGKFVFLPNTLALVFKRFSCINRVERKKHSIVDLKREIFIPGNEPSYYLLKACALHHGYHIHNGHYTALFFYQDTVIEVDDERAHDRTLDWKVHADTTVYMAFYVKQRDFKSRKIGAKQNEDCTKRECQEIPDIDEKKQISEVEDLWDVTTQNSLICSISDFGYELKGRDFKTLEHPIVNHSYTLEHAGWLNDNVIDAYIHLLAKTAAADKGIRVHAFNCLFIKRLREVLLQKRCERDLYKMLSTFHKKIVFEALEYIIIPVNTKNGQHWTVISIDIRRGCIYFYDPMRAGTQNVTDVKLIKFYFEQFYKYNSYEVEVLGKRFVSDFDVIWEGKFACQSDGASCGVYVLMYVCRTLGLLTRDHALIDNIPEIRKEIAMELHQGKKSLLGCRGIPMNQKKVA
jgi:hypothetical protein